MNNSIFFKELIKSTFRKWKKICLPLFLIKILLLLPILIITAFIWLDFIIKGGGSYLFNGVDAFQEIWNYQALFLHKNLFLIIGIIILILGVIPWVLFYAVCYHSAIQVYRSRALSIKSALKSAISSLPSMLKAYAMIFTVAFIGIMSLFVIGYIFPSLSVFLLLFGVVVCYIICIEAFVLFPIILDQKKGFFKSYSKSSKMTKGYGAKILFYFLLIALGTYVFKRIGVGLVLSFIFSVFFDIWTIVFTTAFYFKRKDIESAEAIESRTT